MTNNVKGFLDLIAWSEGTSTSSLTQHDGYDVIVSGPDGPEVFTDFSQHPFTHRIPKVVRPGLASTASGRYQILFRFWEIYSERLSLPDFSPASQDAVAIQQIRERRAIALIESGDIAGAIRKCGNIWASLPCNGYGQGGHTLEALLEHWHANNSTQETV